MLNNFSLRVSFLLMPLGWSTNVHVRSLAVERLDFHLSDVPHLFPLYMCLKHDSRLAEHMFAYTLHKPQQLHT